jgi:TolB-like protein/tetratricopeptide (TPR) repeat protein
LEGDFAKKNIAVLYYQDRSPKKELGYLADGITEALIDELSAVSQLKVASRNGSAAFKGKDGIPTDSIARTLTVGTVVDGTVEPRGDGRLRVTVRLNDALTGSQIGGSKQVEMAAGDMLALQDSIAKKVSELVRQGVGAEIKELKARTGTRNAAAWEAMHRAKQTEDEVDALIAARDVPAALAKISQADSALAKVEAMDRDWQTPIVERAWLGYRAARIVGPGGADFTKWIDAGLAHADRALKQSPNAIDAIEARGTLHYLQWLTNLAPNPTAAAQLLASAEQDLGTASKATPPRASAWNVLSHLLINKGQLSEAKLAAENAYRADPFLANVDLTVLRLFLASLDLGDRNEATKWCAEGRARFPQSYRFTECKLWLYSLPAPTPPNMAEVWQTYAEYVKVSPANVQAFNELKGKMIVALAYVRANQPDSAKALAAASQGNPSIDPPGELTNLATIVYAQAGDKDTALELLARYFAANPQQRAFAAKDKAWWLEELRKDPRYQALIKGLN